ncbi:MAG: Tetratricopeptide repeat protein [Bacteroidetes bacterium ADurb.Bin416]|nr:MAG: Tetratricopeptide repeat protein [Bacteroidetes bacterium ADurb.Bin416]
MMRNCLIITFLSVLVMVPINLDAQKVVRKSIRQGNKVYEKEKYTEAEIAYLKALETDPTSKEANYNLGNALFKQEKMKEAFEKYQLSLSKETDPLKKAAIFHNSGNSLMAVNDYEKAVNLYKSALRLNPADDETRYNLAVAQALLRKQQQEQQQDKEDKKDEEKKEEQDKEQQQQQQQQDDQQKQQQQQQQQQQQEAEEQVSREKAQQLLDALMQDEKDTQEKVKKLQMQQGRAKNPEKDW